MEKMRLDMALVERGLVKSRAIAQRLVMAGKVRVNGQILIQPAAQIPVAGLVELMEGPAFVSRGGEKLEAALTTFNVPVTGRICADAGASTGGFTDCLLQHGAARVYAIDVGKGILSWKLRQDNRVVVMEKTNARYVQALPEPVSLVTVDVSFISLKLLFPVIKQWFQTGVESSLGQADHPASTPPPNQVIALIKPQFEAGRAEVSRSKGIIRDQEIHQRVVADLQEFAIQLGYIVRGLIQSPLLGPKGNQEFLILLEFPGG